MLSRRIGIWIKSCWNGYRWLLGGKDGAGDRQRGYYLQKAKNCESHSIWREEWIFLFLWIKVCAGRGEGAGRQGEEEERLVNASIAWYSSYMYSDLNDKNRIWTWSRCGNWILYVGEWHTKFAFLEQNSGSDGRKEWKKGNWRWPKRKLSPQT